MSLPSQCLFMKDGKEVHRAFVNIGWSDRDEYIPNCILDAAETLRSEKGVDLKTLEIDEFRLYGRIVKYEDMQAFYKKEIDMPTLIERFQPVPDNKLW